MATRPKNRKNGEKDVAKKTGTTTRSQPAQPQISAVEVAEFTRGFAEKVEAGVSLVRSLAELQEQQSNAQLKRVIDDVNQAVQTGSTLSGAMARHPQAFEKWYIDAVRLGEVNGNLDLMLHGLAHNDDILSFDDAVKFLGTSKPTLYRLLKQGDIKGLRVGRQWRFQKSALNAYMERRPSAIASAPLQELEAQIEYFAAELQRHDIEPPNLMSTKAIETDEAAPPDEQKVVQLLKSVFLLALHEKASDIHLDPQRDDVVLRFRRDGVLQEIRRFPPGLLQPLVDRLKVMTDMKIEEKRIPQDGRMHLHSKRDARDFDVRAALIPTSYGESVVMRILDQSNVIVALDNLQMDAADLARMRDWLHRPNGVILVTGPTGSGKTTTLYSCINELNLPDRKIVTIEDPVEYQLPGLLQVHVNRKAGLLFANALRAFLRQDPDIIMVGEIRDLETAEGAMRAALSGHLLLSTLHVNSATEAPFILRNMGIEPFIMASALVGISAQRLARRICTDCKEEASLSTELLASLQKLAPDGGYTIPKAAKFHRGRGCERCRQSGYRGRVPIYELLNWSSELSEAFIAGTEREELTRLAVQGGMKTMLADGVRKAVDGETTVEEVLRVLAVTI